MKQLLIIFVRRYPYDFGEPFLESEIYKHIDHYNKIVVLSQDVGISSKQTRTPPKEIQYINTATSDRKSLRINDICHIPIYMLKPDVAMQEEMQLRKLNFLQKGFLAYFEARCQRLLKEAIVSLQDIDLHQYDKITLYSYWLFANANVALYLKDYFYHECGYTGKIVLVSRAHRYDIYEEANKTNYLPFRSRLLNGIDRIFPCSADGTKYIQHKYPSMAAKVTTAYLGSRDYGRNTVIDRDGIFHIVSCSRVVKVKRLERLIDELSLLAPGRTVKWTHIGGGINGKKQYFDSVCRYAKNKLHNIQYEFIGPLSNEDVYTYYKTNPVDVFVNCSYSEGLPVSLMEASGFGIPIIATDVGGAKEIIDNEKNGFLLDRDFSVGELAEIVNRMLLFSVNERNAIRNAARAIWEKRFNAEKNYDAFSALLASL